MDKELIINRQPLVSIMVITYNSSEFVCETLDSVYAQTYPNIEIIITDDCSTDSTLQVCREWMADHKDRSIRIELVTANKNTGVSENCNRGLEVSKGEWIKPIAGDDILLPDAIRSYVSFVNKHHDCKVLFGKERWFSGSYPNYVIQDHSISLEHFFFRIKTAKRQYRILCRVFAGSGPSSFLNVNTIKEVGCFDERFPLREDYPLYIKLSKAGYRFYLQKSFTVLYRRNNFSITSAKDGDNSIFVRSRVRYVKEDKFEYQMENLNWIWRIFLRFSIWMQNLIIDTGNSYNSWKSVALFNLYRIVDPFIWYGRIYVLLDKIIGIIKN